MPDRYSACAKEATIKKSLLYEHHAFIRPSHSFNCKGDSALNTIQKAVEVVLTRRISVNLRSR